MPEQSREIFIEHIKVGNSFRVTAIDAGTGIEVTFQAPASMTTWDMQQMAVRKLKYVLRKKKAEEEQEK